MDWVNAVVQGTLLGGLYAMFAAGLSLIFGVMRLVNIAHGDLIVLSAYVALSGAMLLGVSPFVVLILAVPVMAAFGYLLQRLVLNRTMGDDILPPLLVTFGLSIILQNGMLEAFSADTQRLSFGPLSEASIPLFGGLAGSMTGGDCTSFCLPPRSPCKMPVIPKENSPAPTNSNGARTSIDRLSPVDSVMKHKTKPMVIAMVGRAFTINH